MTLLVVSNRLPFTVNSRDNKLVFHASPGGLVSGLTAYLEWARQDPSGTDYLWVGWPGMEVEEGSRELLRTKAGKQKACPVFLDAPFPSYDVFRTLPTTWRREILEGILGADLIGFHTIDYTQHFLRCILRILGYEHSFGQVLVGGERTIKVDTFPMGVDYREI